MSHVSLLIVAIYFAALLSIPLAVKRSRTPQGATAWCVALISFPLIALPLFLVFGRSKFYGYVESHRAAAAHVASRLSELHQAIRHAAGLLPDEWAPFAKIMEDVNKMPFARGNRVELLVDGHATYESMIATIGEAKSYILLQSYIFRDDGIGSRMIHALKERSQAGVAVYVLYDKIGSMDLGQSFIRQCEDHGISIRAFVTSRRGSRWQINFRNHRKILVVDGRSAHVGGLNIGDDYLGLYQKVGRWRDTHMRVMGPAAIQAQVAFAKDWFWAAGEMPRLLWTIPDVAGDALVAITHTGPADATGYATLTHLEAFNRARTRIWIATPYFVPDEPIERAMELAARRGVEVRCLLPARNDNLMIQMASLTYVERLQKAGVVFYRYPSKSKGFLHQKCFLIDEDLSAVGSTNLDNRSLHINFETQAFVWDRGFARAMHDVFMADFQQAEKISLDYFARKNYWRKLAAKVVNLAAPIL
jgi:cardiolipin synthase